MLYKTHILGAVGLSILVKDVAISQELMILEQSQISTIIGSLSTGFAVLGGLIPDIDKPKSYLGNRFKILSVPIKYFTGHRHLFHFWQFYALVYVLLLNYGKTIGSATSLALYSIFIKMLFLGIFSHLLLDLFTTGGIPLRIKHLKKKTKKEKDYHRGNKISLANFKTGGKEEKIIRFVLFILIIFKLFG